jgi:hypothetical protein
MKSNLSHELGSPPITANARESVVLRVESDGTIVVPGAQTGEVLCEVLVTGEVAPILLSPRDRVLVWQSDTDLSRGVVLGRLGPSHSPEAPDALMLEASQELTLRVGEGSLTIRKDGKILIKGKDLVSHAQRINRIKGGSVSIN